MSLGPEIEILACHISVQLLKYLPHPSGMLLTVLGPHPQWQAWGAILRCHTVSSFMSTGWGVGTFLKGGPIRFSSWDFWIESENTMGSHWVTREYSVEKTMEKQRKPTVKERTKGNANREEEGWQMKKKDAKTSLRLLCQHLLSALLLLAHEICQTSMGPSWCQSLPEFFMLLAVYWILMDPAFYR